MADTLNPKVLKRVVKRNAKTKATDQPLEESHRTWSMNARPKKAPQPAGESWWLIPANLEREIFQSTARDRHPNKLGLTLKPYP